MKTNRFLFPLGPLALFFLAACQVAPATQVGVSPAASTGSPTPDVPDAPLPIALTLVVDGQTRAWDSMAASVGGALWEAGYPEYLADAVTPTWDTPLRNGLVITLTRSSPITLIADGRTLYSRTRATTVGAVLAENGVALVGQDYSRPSLDETVPADGTIRVVRVREDVLTTAVSVPYQTLYQARADWEIDTVQALQAGREGRQEQRTRVRYEDGVEVSRVAEGEFMIQTPQDYIIGYGTQIVIRTLDTPGGPIEYWRSYDMYATSYAAKFTARSPDSPNYGRTASGKIVTKGLVAIDRSLIPFGTRMYVPGYGLAEAADTGGGVKGRWIDLGFDDWNYEGWHWKVTVYFLTPAPPTDQIRWIIPSTVP